MYNFFGIVYFKQTEAKAGLACLEQLNKKFPTSFKNKKSHNSNHIQFEGDYSYSEIQGHSNFFLVGEVYNLSQLSGDTFFPIHDSVKVAHFIHEKIVQHGESFIQKLNGRFAILIFYQQEKIIRLYNDQMGIQQVYYFQDKNAFVFASEIKFLLTHPNCSGKVDWEKALKKVPPFIVLNGHRNYTSWFKDVFLMQEGSCWKIDLNSNQLICHTYWNELNTKLSNCESDNRSEVSIINEYIELLEDAVKLRIQDSDPAYAMLSGGLDSSILCALAIRTKQVDTFSILTQGTLLDDSTEISHNLSNELGFKNTQYIMPYHEMTMDIDLLKIRVWRDESPFMHHDSITKSLPHYQLQQSRPEINYLLTGTGSDQLNGGLVRWVVEESGDPQEDWIKFSQTIKEEELKCFIPRNHDTVWFNKELINQDYLSKMYAYEFEENPWMYYVKSNLHINTYSLHWDENRAASSHGHSIRYPFLDHRFVPFVGGINPKLHSTLFYDKQILRKASRPFLPEYIFNKPKKPSNLSVYNNYFKMYNHFVTHNDQQLLKDAFGDLSKEHEVIDLKKLLNKINHLQHSPDLVTWEYVFHIINLGLLEQLKYQDEQSLNFESKQDKIEVFQFDDKGENLAELKVKFGIKSQEELWLLPLKFNVDCGLIYNELQAKHYLIKNNILSYEIEEDQKTWKSFLSLINQHRNTNEILDAGQIEWNEIKDYYYQILNEGFISYVMP
ncbi:MAG: asparagine synthase-related protein [Saprospiraceae bacterium]